MRRGVLEMPEADVNLRLYNLNAGGVTVPNVLLGMLIFAGGLTLMLVAIIEFIRGYTLFATCK